MGGAWVAIIDFNYRMVFFFFFLSSTALGGLWLPSQLAAMYFVHVLSLSIYQSSFVLGHQHLGATSS
jgi:hypothetical protein